MNWKISLDRWLTTEPEDDYTPFWEGVVESFTESFYNVHEDFIHSCVCDGLIEKLYDKGRDIQTTARIIERYFYIIK